MESLQDHGAVKSKKTRTETIREQLADAIVRGKLAGGVALDETDLAREFGVSRTPIREAIRQLEAIGFAEARPRRGAVVTDITPERLDEMFAVMGEMEALCASLAAKHMTAKERAALVAIHEQCAEAVKDGELERYYDLNFEFHETIYRGTHNSFLAELTLHVRQRVAPFRRAQFSTMGRFANSVIEHSRVVQAICRGDGETAAEEMRRHMTIVRGSVDSVSPASHGARDMQPTA